MAATGVRNVWGVGRRIAETLRASGVHSVLDLVRVDAAALRRQFGVVLEKTLRELQGTSCLEMSDVEDAPAAKQQILVSRSFGTPITDEAGIVEAVSEFTSRAAEKLRHQASLAAAVGVFFMTSPYRANDRQHSVNVTVPLVRPTADTGLLVAVAVEAVREHFRAGFRYAKAGAVLSGLQPAAVHQGELDLFPESNTDVSEGAPPKDRTALMDAMDVINRRFGRDAVRIGSTLVASHDQEVRSWATKQERRSPRFTTRWAEMLVVKA